MATENLVSGAFLPAEPHSSGHLQQGKGMQRGLDVQEILGDVSTSYLESHTTLLKISTQNYILRYLGKVKQSPQNYPDQQAKASVLESQPVDCLVMGLGGQIQKGEGKGW